MLGVVDRAAGLDEGRDAGLEADLDRVRERDRTRPRRRPRHAERRRPEIARAFSTACRAASTREVWPEPMPMSRPSRTRTIALEVTPRTRRQARSRSRRSASVGARRVAICHVAGSSGAVSGAPTRTAPPAVRIAPSGSSGSAGASSTASSGSTIEPQVRLRGEDLAGVVVEAGRDDDLEEEARETLGGRRVDRAGQRHDAAEGRDRVAGERRVPRLAERRPLGRAARVRVLDDDARRARAAARPIAAAADASRTLL